MDLIIACKNMLSAMLAEYGKLFIWFQNMATISSKNDLVQKMTMVVIENDYLRRDSFVKASKNMPKELLVY